jgi:hypothetical protein
MKTGWRSALAAAAIALAVAGQPGCADAPAPRYDEYRSVLMAFVDGHGLVDYASMKEQSGDLDDFIVYLERLDPKVYERWSERDKIAFWINAYNAHTLRAILDNYPIVPAQPNLAYPANSIRQIPRVWDFRAVNVMGRETTLGFIETSILRRDFHEPRVRMALVSAALSCPPLRNEPYEGARLDAQLDDQTRKFLADPNHLYIDRVAKQVRVSQIFQWHAEDFAPAGTPRAALARAGLRTFVAPFVSADKQAFLASDDYAIGYFPFDWTLNDQTH